MQASADPLVPAETPQGEVFSHIITTGESHHHL